MKKKRYGRSRHKRATGGAHCEDFGGRLTEGIGSCVGSVNEPCHALLGSGLDLLDRVRHVSRNRRKATLTMGDGKTAEEGQRHAAQAAAALNW